MSPQAPVAGGLVGGVVLAAGASRRAGRIKALATIDGEPFVLRAVRALRGGGCDEVVVVVGPPHAELVAASFEGLAERRDNEHPEDGMLSSLRVGLSDRWSAAVVSLVDHPRVCAATVARLIGAWRAADVEVVRPVYEGRRGHPYLVGRPVFDALREGEGEGGARAILARRSSLDVQVDDAGVHDDLDTPERIDAVADPSPDDLT